MKVKNHLFPDVPGIKLKKAELDSRLISAIKIFLEIIKSNKKKSRSLSKC